MNGTNSMNKDINNGNIEQKTSPQEPSLKPHPQEETPAPHAEATAAKGTEKGAEALSKGDPKRDSGGPFHVGDAMRSQAKPAELPKTYLALSIVCTILFCLPLGIPAMVHASRVQSLYDLKLYWLAEESSKKARKWCIFSIIMGVIFYLTFIPAAVSIFKETDIMQTLEDLMLLFY